MLCLYSVGNWNGIECIFRKEGYNLCTIEIWPLCVFLCHFDSTGFNTYTICLKMSSDTLWSGVFNNSHSDEDCFDSKVLNEL